MGPRSGSPATETLRDKDKAVLHRRAAARGGATAFLFLSLGLIGRTAWASTAETSHTVTVVVVKSALSISEDTGDFSLKFNHPAAGAESSSQTVNYRVAGNNFPNGSLSGIVSVSVAGSAQGVELKANVGAFTNNGTQGDIVLHRSFSGDQVVGAAPTPLADKEVTSGTQGNVLNGTLPVTWKAGAKQDLSVGEYPTQLTVTLKDT